MIHNLY